MRPTLAGAWLAIARWVALLSAIACVPAPIARARAPNVSPKGPEAPQNTQRRQPALREGLDVAYTLELVDSPFPFVGVTLVAHGAPSGTTHLGLNNWGGINHTENEVHGLRVEDADGHDLAVQRAPDAGRGDGEGEGPTWIVRNEPNAILRVHYALVSTQYDVGHESSSYYRPLIQPTFFHAIGNTTLLYVRDVPDGLHLNIAFHWQGFEEKGWKVASSFSVDQHDFEVTETLDDFRQAVFLAGELRLVRRDLGPTRSPLWIAILGNDWGFTDNSFADAAASVVLAGRTFFQDYDWPFFFISVIPVGTYKAGSYTQGGTGLTHSFALFLTPKTEIATKENGTGILWLLSHELFHLWNGQRYDLLEPEQLGYWFSEGFTNFYARRLLFRSGLARIEPFVENLNDELMHYALSPVRDEPATRIAADFWRDHEVEKLPYIRGDVVAMMVDAEIRKASRGERSLDDLMKELLAARHEPRPKVSSETFLEAIARYTSAAFADRIRKIVVLGSPAEIGLKVLEPCLHGRLEPIGAYDAGFNEGAARARRIITGVSASSNAYRAGLRNGQAIKGWSLHRGDPKIPVEITIDDGGNGRTIRYLPQGRPSKVVQFAADAQPDQACSKIL